MKISSYLPIQYQNYNQGVLQLLVSATLVFSSQYLCAAEVTKEIIIGTAVDYDSNPDMVQRNQDPVLVYSLVPRFKLSIANESNLWYMDAMLLVQRHNNEKVLVDREDPKMIVGWDRTYESGAYGIKFEYAEASARVAELKSTGVFITGGGNKDATEKSKILSGKWLHTINPKWSVLTEGGYSDFFYTLPGSLQGYNIADIKSKLSYANTEKLTTSVQLGYQQLLPDKALDNTNLARLIAGAEYEVADGFKLLSRAGMYNLSGRQSETDWEAGIKAEYNKERMNYVAEINRELSPSGVGGFQKIDSLRLGWLYFVTDRDRVGADYAFYKAKADDKVGFAKLENQLIGGFYERNLNPHWKTRVSAGYKQQKTPDTTSQGNLIGVSLIYETLSF